MKHDSNITVVLTIINEAENLENCVKSARNLTNDIIVVDTGSSDNSLQIAKSLGLETYEFPYSHVVEPSRNFAISKARGEWLYILDADERITPKLAQEIKHTIKNTSHTHFQNPRKNIFAYQKAMIHGGWYPDLVTRLILKSQLVDWPVKIHSRPVINGSCGLLKQDLVHFFHIDLTRMLNKTSNYEQKVAGLLFEARREVSVKTFFRKFLAEFYKRELKGMGFRDGIYGLIENFYQAFSQTITWIFLWEKYENEKITHH